MKITIKYTKLDHSPILNEYVEKKLLGLGRLIKKFELENEVLARVEIARTTKHHQKGPVYRAEVNLDLPHRMLRAEKEDWNIRLAVDQVKDALRAEIVKYKETLS